MNQELTNLNEVAPQAGSAQVDIAKRYPRDIRKCIEVATEIVLSSPELAATCIYCLPPNKGDKPTETRGPSIRLAEIMVYCWGNLKYGARIKSNDGKQIIVEGAAWDLEKNIECTSDVVKSIVTREGRSYGPSMQATATLAALAIARRNAVFQVVPRVIINEIYEIARKCAIGDISSLPERRQKAIEYFSKLGIQENRILAFLQKGKREELDLDDLEYMLGISNAIKDNQITVDEAFSVSDLELAGTTTREKIEILEKARRESK